MPRFASASSSLFYNGATAGNPYLNAIMLFAQATTPTGWTRQDNGYGDSTIRITSGTGNVFNNSVNVSTAMTNTYVALSGSGTTTHTITPHILSASEICSHQHTSPVPRGQVSTNGNGVTGSAGYGIGASPTTSYTQTAPYLGGSGAAHTHPDGTVNLTFTSTARPMAVKYLDSIMAAYTG